MGRQWRSLQKPSPLVEGRFPQLCHALPNRGGQPPYGTRIRSKEEKQQHRGQGRFLHHCCEPFLNGIKWTPSLEFTECADGDSRLGVSGPWCCFHRHSSFYPVEFPNLSPKCCHYRYIYLSPKKTPPMFTSFHWTNNWIQNLKFCAIFILKTLVWLSVLHCHWSLHFMYVYKPAGYNRLFFTLLW